MVVKISWLLWWRVFSFDNPCSWFKKWVSSFLVLCRGQFSTNQISTYCTFFNDVFWSVQFSLAYKFSFFFEDSRKFKEFGWEWYSQFSTRPIVVALNFQTCQGKGEADFLGSRLFWRPGFFIIWFLLGLRMQTRDFMRKREKFHNLLFFMGLNKS